MGGGMNVNAVRAMMTEAHNCAMEMLANASFIEKELPKVNMPDSLRAMTEKVCSGLIGTKFDIVTELSELDELLGAPDPEAHVISPRVNRIVAWLKADVDQMHELITALDANSKENPAHGLAYMLVAESATNILTAFNATTAAADKINAAPPNPYAAS